MAKKTVGAQAPVNPFTAEHGQLIEQVLQSAAVTRDLLGKLQKAFGGLDEAIAENEEHYRIALELKSSFFPSPVVN